MSIPILTFFNNRSGVGKTSLAYRLAWMFAELEVRVLVVDADPQMQLTSTFLTEDTFELLWEQKALANTLFRCITPLLEGKDIYKVHVQHIQSNLALLPGDIALSSCENIFALQWNATTGEKNSSPPIPILSAFWQVAQAAAEDFGADLILFDVAPNLGAINRSALSVSDYVIIPLGTDLFSLLGLHYLGPTLREWRNYWHLSAGPAASLPAGKMAVIGYVMQQYAVKLSRPVRAYTRWPARIPQAYRRHVLNEDFTVPLPTVENDPFCLGMMKHYYSLLPLAKEARKPIFHLRPADGAIGAHANAVGEAYDDFKQLAEKILHRVQ